MAFRYTSLKTYQRAGDLQKVVNDYFRECDRDDVLPTLSGLAIRCSCSVRALQDWSKLPEFAPILDEAWARIENKYETVFPLQGGKIKLSRPLRFLDEI